jgi:hypothetical protein
MGFMGGARFPIAAVVASGLLVACGGPEASGEVATGPARAEATEVVAGDSYFQPDTISAPAGEEVTVEVTNEGDMPHEFSIDKLGISTGAIDPRRDKDHHLRGSRGHV